MKSAVYIRVSTGKEEQKQSLENQKELFMNLISEKGWDLYDIYLDIQSGTKQKTSRIETDDRGRKNEKV